MDQARHVAIIMDGNGRWARQQGKSRRHGHREGVKALERVARAAADSQGINYLTVFAFSTENWKRPGREVKFLFNLLRSTIRNELDKLQQDEQIRVQVIGRLQELDSDIQEDIKRIERISRDNRELVLTVAVNYGGRAEIIDAVNNIISKRLNQESAHRNKSRDCREQLSEKMKQLEQFQQNQDNQKMALRDQNHQEITQRERDNQETTQGDQNHQDITQGNLDDKEMAQRDQDDKEIIQRDQNHQDITQVNQDDKEMAQRDQEGKEMSQRKLDGKNEENRLISESELENHLYHPDLPEVDLLIRTGGEQRISNFLLWQISYAELYFTPVLWPDFSADDLDEALQDYVRRQRKFGGLPGEER